MCWCKVYGIQWIPYLSPIDMTNVDVDLATTMDLNTDTCSGDLGWPKGADCLLAIYYMTCKRWVTMDAHFSPYY